MRDVAVLGGRGTQRFPRRLTAVWGAITGVAPHVLHHVGPLAGAALLAGAGGKALFFLIGVGASTPMLIRLYRRFGSWLAPATAVLIFALTYTVSSVLVAPLFNDDATVSPPSGVTSTTHGHDH